MCESRHPFFKQRFYSALKVENELLGMGKQVLRVYHLEITVLA